jgi:hypothetical protein
MHPKIVEEIRQINSLTFCVTEFGFGGQIDVSAIVIPISPLYRGAIKDALVLQVIIGVFALMILDFGQCAQICGIALIAFWGGAATIICRRPENPTTTDLTLVRFGYLLVIPVAAFLASFIWKLRGF